MLMAAAMFFVFLAVQVFVFVEPWLAPLHMIQGPARYAAPRVIIGPYPHAEELVRLKKRVGVVEIVSLLNPAIPGESQLLEKERQAAEAAGLKFKSYPMSYLVPGNAANQRTAKALAAFVLAEYGGASKKTVYIHCYLGRHRTGLAEKAISRALTVKNSRSEASTASDK